MGAGFGAVADDIAHDKRHGTVFERNGSMEITTVRRESRQCGIGNVKRLADCERFAAQSIQSIIGQVWCGDTSVYIEPGRRP